MSTVKRRSTRRKQNEEEQETMMLHASSSSSSEGESSPVNRRTTPRRSTRKTPRKPQVSTDTETDGEMVVPKSIDKKTKNSENIPNESNDTFEYEFGGPIGALGVIVGLPIVIYLLYFTCNKDFCIVSLTDVNNIMTSIPLPRWEDLWTREANIMFLGWMLANVILERILPGEVVEGNTLPDLPGRARNMRLKYTMSGHLQFWILLLAMGHAIPHYIKEVDTFRILGFRPLQLDLIYDHYLPLITISIVFSFGLSVYLYLSSFLPDGKQLAKGGDSGNMIYDFFIGRELNPRIGSFDLKEFCELRPGLIGWFVINLGMATKQFLMRKKATGEGSISLSMMSVNLFQGLYVWDALYNEKAILTTMDITTDGFGFMLAFGDLAWVPFIYSLQARYLVDYDPNLSTNMIIFIVIIHFLGYYIFRSANSEKDAFRRDPFGPSVRHLKYMQTQRGTRLLTSGWWGAARKINYTGDWLVTFSWCLLCGFDSPIPYFQAVYFLILLIHRANRDDKMCQEKYGDDWTEYKKRVPYMFIPGII